MVSRLVWSGTIFKMIQKFHRPRKEESKISEIAKEVLKDEGLMQRYRSALLEPAIHGKDEWEIDPDHPALERLDGIIRELDNKIREIAPEISNSNLLDARYAVVQHVTGRHTL